MRNDLKEPILIVWMLLAAAFILLNSHYIDKVTNQVTQLTSRIVQLEQQAAK